MNARRAIGVGALVLAATLVGCTKASPSRASATFAICPGVADYFPVGALAPEEDADQFVREWYSGHLEAMAEPSFQCESQWPAYRFLWLRTFDHPIAIRIEQRVGGMLLSAVELDGAGGYDPGKVSRRVERELGADEADAFLRTLDRAGVWANANEGGERGLDGAQWIVEARDGKRYRIHDRWSPARGPVRDMGLAFLALAGWDVPPDELY